MYYTPRDPGVKITTTWIMEELRKISRSLQLIDERLADIEDTLQNHEVRITILENNP